jgi:hypothetical protein
VALAAASAVSCIVAIVHLGGRLRAPALTAVRAAQWRHRTFVDIVVILVAAAVWLFALGGTDVSNVGQFGLLSVLWPVFWIAPLLLVGGALVEIKRGAHRGGALAAYLTMLILVVHGTTPILLTLPEYSWTYKHIGVISFFASGQHINSATDIYQQWPAFFTAAAQLTGASSVPALNYASWAPVVFNLAGSVVLYAIARALSPDRRVAFATVLLFQCINWIEADYLSPQGFAFVLYLGVFLILVRYLRSADPPLRFLHNGLPPASPGRHRGWAIAAVLSLTLVVTATHQLSPYLLAGSVVVLVLLGLVRPAWLAVAVPAIPVLYLIPRYTTVSGTFGIVDSLNVFGHASGTTAAWGSIGPAASAVVVRALTLVVWGLVATYAWRNRRTLGQIAVPLVLAIVPFGLLFVQNYGGEAIDRVYLFTAPWCAFLLARWGIGLVARRFAVIATTLVLTVSLAAAMQGRHGQLTVDQQTPEAIQAAQYLYEHGEPGATILLATPDFPGRISANYDQFNRSVAMGEPDLVTGARLTGMLNGDAIPAIKHFADSFQGTTTYLVISDEMRRQAAYFGYLPSGSLDALDAALAQAPQWTVFYRNADVIIYQLHG